jgi:pimeloyl-ACP methyl ester carboxylesterase
VGFDQLARDAHAAQVQLAKRTGLPLDRIGWVGLSQGGWIAPLAAIHAAKGGYVASVSAAAVPVFQQIRHEVTRTLEREGVGPEGVSAAHGLMQALEGFALGTVPWERYLAIRTGLMDGPAGPFAAAMPDTREDWRWEWWARVGLYDPVEAWNRSGHPTLVVYGAEDEQDNVPVATSVERLHALRQRPGAPRLDAHVLPGLGHALVDPESGWVSAGALERLAGWILDAVGSKGGAG